MWKVLLLLSFVFWWMINRWKRRHLIKLSNQLPSKFTYIPFLGHAWKLIGLSYEDFMKVIIEFGLTTNDVGGHSSFWNRDQLFIVVTKPETLDFILKSPVCLGKGEIFDVIKEFSGNGIIFAEESIWRSRRKRITPCFNTKKLNNLANIFSEQSIIMANLLQSKADSGKFPMQSFLNNFAMDAVHLINLGENINSQLQSNNSFLEAYDYVVMHITKRVCQPWFNSPICKLFPEYKKAHDLKCFLYDYFEKIIERKKMSMKTKIELGSDGKTINEQKGSFLEMLIKESDGENGYSVEELREELLAITIAAVDTSVASLSFTLLMMAKNPEIQEKVFQEIKEVLGDINRPLESNDVNRLTYLNAVIKESLRLYPPAPVIVRVPSEEITLPSGHTIYPECTILINIYAVHRNPQYWGHDADIYRPERFLEGPLKHPAQYIPFSYGIRNCLGNKYAMMTMKTSLANIIKKFRVIWPTKPKDGLTVTEETPIRTEYKIVMKNVEQCIVCLETRK